MNGPDINPRSPSNRRQPPGPLEQLEFPLLPPRPVRRHRTSEAAEYKVVSLRECPLPERLMECDCPQKAADYWRLHVASTVHFNPDVETFVVLHLNTRRRVRGHHIVATGILDGVQVHGREVFRTAIVAASSAVILMHNHPSGDPTPSSADLHTTRELVRAGQLLRIEVLDHVIVGEGRHLSLKELGVFHG